MVGNKLYRRADVKKMVKLAGNIFLNFRELREQAFAEGR